MAIRLRPFEASEYLHKKHGIKRGVGTLAKYRCLGGGGPKYQRAGREILYEPRHLESMRRKSSARMFRVPRNIGPQALQRDAGLVSVL